MAFFIVPSSIFIALRVRALCIQFQISNTTLRGYVCVCVWAWVWWWSHLKHNNTIFCRRVSVYKDYSSSSGYVKVWIDRLQQLRVKPLFYLCLSHSLLSRFILHIIPWCRLYMTTPFTWTVHIYKYITLRIHFNWIACHASLWELYDIRLKMPRHNMIILTLSIPHSRSYSYTYTHRHHHRRHTNTVNTSKQAGKQTFSVFLQHTYTYIELLSRLIFHSFQVVLLLRHSVLSHTHIHIYDFFKLGPLHSWYTICTVLAYIRLDTLLYSTIYVRRTH